MNISWKQIKAEIDGLPKTEKTLALKKMADGFEKELREFLDAENKNYDAAGAMANCSEREELLSYSWGRIKMLKHILGDFK